MQLIYLHIAKCAGNTVKNIFKQNGYRIINVCDWRCCGSNSVPNTEIPLINSRAKCKKIIRYGQSGKILQIMVHHVLPRDKLKDDYIFTTIRNPYTWYISLWSYSLVVNKS